jgi:hypothetical protein
MLQELEALAKNAKLLRGGDSAAGEIKVRRSRFLTDEQLQRQVFPPFTLTSIGEAP